MRMWRYGRLLRARLMKSRRSWGRRTRLPYITCSGTSSVRAAAETPLTAGRAALIAFCLVGTDLVLRSVCSLQSALRVVRRCLWSISMKPGKPFAYGRIGASHFVGLPGNPVSSFVTFLLLVRPFLLQLQGVPSVTPTVEQTRADFDWLGRKGFCCWRGH